MELGELTIDSPGGITWQGTTRRESLYANPFAEYFPIDVRQGAYLCLGCRCAVVDFSPQPLIHEPLIYEKPMTMEDENALLIDHLVDVLRSRDAENCAEAIEAFVRLGAPAVPALRALLEDEDPGVRADARRILERIGNA